MRHLLQGQRVRRVGAADDEHGVGPAGDGREGRLAVGGGEAEVVARRRPQLGVLGPRPLDHTLPVTERQGRLGQDGDLGRVVDGGVVDVVLVLHEPHGGRRLGQGADGLVVAGVADVEDGVALAGPDPGLVVDLGHERAHGVDHETAPVAGGGHHVGGRAVGREHHRGAVGKVVDAVDEDDPEVPEPLHHEPVVDDLVVAVDGRLEDPDHPGQGLDGHLHAGAEPAGAGQQHLLDFHTDEVNG